jgi:hypothetical protein
MSTEIWWEKPFENGGRPGDRRMGVNVEVDYA